MPLTTCSEKKKHTLNAVHTYSGLVGPRRVTQNSELCLFLCLTSDYQSNRQN